MRFPTHKFGDQSRVNTKFSGSAMTPLLFLQLPFVVNITCLVRRRTGIEFHVSCELRGGNNPLKN